MKDIQDTSKKDIFSSKEDTEKASEAEKISKAEKASEAEKASKAEKISKAEKASKEEKASEIEKISKEEDTKSVFFKEKFKEKKEKALEITGLKIAAINGKMLVDGVSLSVEYGKTVALVGESGCGKTMTSAAVMGLLPPGVHKISGDIRICGAETAKLSPEAYRALRNVKASVVMQNPMSAFDPVLTVFSHFLETSASHRGGDKKSVRASASQSLTRVGFQDPEAVLDLYPFQMSGGMLQRVMLAIALTENPPLIIADEATTDLDVVSQAKILSLLQDHCAGHNAALLLITHDFGVAKSLADEIALMKNGSIIEHRKTDDFFKHPQSEYAQKLLHCYKGLYTDRFKKIIEKIRGKNASA
jgi:ABC-type dipeptide/oligopeptide/nickel transport system ATPase component